MSNEQSTMTISSYIRSKGLSVRLVAQKMGVRRQAIENYGKLFNPTEKTLTKVATAMTALGVPTTVVDLYQATHHTADAQ